MREINRSILIPKPREPYLAWVRSLGDGASDVTLAELRDDCTALLVPEIEDDEDAEAFLAEHHDTLFEYLLAEWVDEPESWPQRRDLETLREWFDLEFSSLAFDVCDWPLERYEIEGEELDDEPGPDA